MSTCPFCQLPPERIICADKWAMAIRDGFPVSPGHTLIIPRRHVRSFFEVSLDERESLLALLSAARAELLKTYQPDSFNIGINDGVAAGQTVMHLHIHLIPRFTGDQPDPRGGVRWVIPAKADYWTQRDD